MQRNIGKSRNQACDQVQGQDKASANMVVANVSSDIIWKDILAYSGFLRATWLAYWAPSERMYNRAQRRNCTIPNCR